MQLEEKEIAGIRYADSEIDPRILRAVEEMGFEQMTPIQAQAIPVMMSGKDMIGQAQTGTGKTAAFGIPLLQRIDPEERSLQAIVLCPTRELAIQAADELRKLAKFMHGIKVLPVYGGQEISKQIRSLKSDIQIVVGTPGRVMDHMRRHTIKMQNIQMVVLDEADEMLNMGFREDMETILGAIEGEHQTVLFSATMPKPILQITKEYQKDAVMIKVAAKELTIPLVKQYYYEVQSKNKLEVTCRLMDYYDPKRSLIFCNTKKMVDELSESLKGRGYFAEGLHGDMSQAQRDKVMNQFRNGTLEILIATDVAARGIDVDDVEAVFNYDVPQDIEYYVHRIGRTGRAGRKGRSFTLVVGREIYKIREIEHICKTKIKPRRIPSVTDVTTAKADKLLTKALEALREEDLDKMTRIIEEKLDEEDITALELAAAFLKLQMGEEPEEIQMVSYKPEKYRRRKDEGGKGGDRDRRGSGEKKFSGEKKHSGKKAFEKGEYFYGGAYKRRSDNRDKDGKDKKRGKSDRPYGEKKDGKYRKKDK